MRAFRSNLKRAGPHNVLRVVVARAGWVISVREPAVYGVFARCAEAHAGQE